MYTTLLFLACIAVPVFVTYGALRRPAIDLVNYLARQHAAKRTRAHRDRQVQAARQRVLRDVLETIEFREQSRRKAA